MEKSESIKELSKSLFTFHEKVGKIKKDAKNPFFKSNYATLSNILDVIQEPLKDSGLVFSQLPEGDDSLTTILIHVESGEFISSTNNMKPVKNDPQALGSAITYSRRYALGAILGLNIDEDDDGNKATQAPSKKWLNPNTPEWTKTVEWLKKDSKNTIETIQKNYQISKENIDKLKTESK